MNKRGANTRPWRFLLLGIPGLVYLAFIGLPLLALVVRAASDAEFLGSLFSHAALTALRLSVVTSAFAVLLTLAIGTPLAYLLARTRSRWLSTVDALVELPIVLPPVVAGLAMLMAFGRNGVLGGLLGGVGIVLPFTTFAVVLAQLFVAAPFYIRSARLGFASVDRGYEETAYTLGLSPWQAFLRVTLPLSWPALVGGLALAWARALSEFGATIMFAGNFPGRTQTMPLAIFTALETDVSAAVAMALLLTAASVLILVLLLLLRHWRGVQPW
jgi:molybdate transport system permease protein